MTSKSILFYLPVMVRDERQNKVERTTIEFICPFCHYQRSHIKHLQAFITEHVSYCAKRTADYMSEMKDFPKELLN